MVDLVRVCSIGARHIIGRWRCLYLWAKMSGYKRPSTSKHCRPITEGCLPSLRPLTFFQERFLIIIIMHLHCSHVKGTFKVNTIERKDQKLINKISHDTIKTKTKEGHRMSSSFPNRWAFSYAN